MARWTVGRVRWPWGVRYDYAISLDTDTVTHSALIGDLDYAADDFLLNFLATYGSGTITVSDGDPEWTQDIATLAGPADHRFYAWHRVATFTGDDGLSWTWTGTGVQAASITVGIHQAGLALGSASDFFDVEAPTFSDSAVSTGVALFLFVWSDTGTSVPGASLVYASDIADFDPPFGVVEVWVFQGPGTHAIDVTADSGDVKFVYWQDVE